MYCYHEFKLRYLKNQKLFSIRVKECMPARWGVADVVPCFGGGGGGGVTGILWAAVGQCRCFRCSRGSWGGWLAGPCGGIWRAMGWSLIGGLALGQVAPPLVPSRALLGVSPVPSAAGRGLGSCVWASAEHLMECGIRVSWLDCVPLALLAGCSTGWQAA